MKRIKDAKVRMRNFDFKNYEATGTLKEIYGENGDIYIKIKINNVIHTLFNAIKLKNNIVKIIIQKH